MQIGDVVMIYEDPLTMQKPEGIAQLVEEYNPDDGDGVSMWVVTFEDDPGREFVRTIKDAGK